MWSNKGLRKNCIEEKLIKSDYCSKLKESYIEEKGLTVGRTVRRLGDNYIEEKLCSKTPLNFVLVRKTI